MKTAMRRLILPACGLTLSLLLISCGGGSSPGSMTDDSTEPPIESPTDNPDNPTPIDEVPADDDPVETPVDPPVITPPNNPPNTDQGSDGNEIDLDEVDPDSLPISLTELPPVILTSAGVSNDNEAPFFDNLTDQVIFAGQEMNLILAPKDSSGMVPGLFTSALPPDSQYIDNFNGTRTIRWRPLQPDVGILSITVTAVDPEVPLYRTEKTIRIQVVLPEDQSTIPNLPPAINGIEDSVVRSGDTVVLQVRGVDPNGTIGPLEALNAPPGSTFTPHPEEDDTKIFRWQTTADDFGVNELRFRTTDAIDASMRADKSFFVRVADPSEFDIPGERLRALADARSFKFGYASVLRWYLMPDADLYAATAAQDFNLVTTENSLKWGLVNPKPDQYRWDAADELVRFAKQHNMVIHGHPLVWHRQLPKWVQKLKRDDRRNAMLKFIREVVNRYNNDIAIWDVVNEALEEDGTFRQSTWFDSMGSSYIASAFKQARIYSRSGILLYNDYDVAWENAKSDAMYSLVQSLQNEGAPIDGVGFQMHLTTSFTDYDSVERNFQRFADLGLDIYITELDIGIVDGAGEQQQADAYGKVLSLCLNQPACKGFQIWGFTDRYSWRKETSPLIFSRAYQPKPAWFTLQSILQGD